MVWGILGAVRRAPDFCIFTCASIYALSRVHIKHLRNDDLGEQTALFRVNDCP